MRARAPACVSNPFSNSLICGLFLRYPHWTAPWDIAHGRFEVRFAGRDLAILPQLAFPPSILGNRMVGLPTNRRHGISTGRRRCTWSTPAGEI